MVIAHAMPACNVPCGKQSTGAAEVYLLEAECPS